MSLISKFILLLFSLHALAIQATPLDEQLSHLTTQKSYLCMNCHRAEEALVGPSYRKISEKYNKLIEEGQLSRAAVEKKLAQAILKGQIGQWGEIIAMPPNHVQGVSLQGQILKLDSNGDMKQILDWILALASR